MKTDTPLSPVKEKIRKSLVYSIYDGIAFSIMFGMSDSFFQAFGIYLGADDLAVGLIRILPVTVGSISQLFAGQVAALFKSRRRFISLFGFFHALMFIPVFLCYFAGAWRVAALSGVLVLTSVVFMLPIPLWSSWMGDLMDERTRGTYLGRRSSITGMMTFPSLLAAGFILQEARALDRTYLGFIIIFSIAFMGRCASSWFLSRKYDPPYAYEERKSLSLRGFFRDARTTNIGPFVLFMGLLNFALSMIASYIDPFLLTSVKLGYVPWTAVTAVLLAVKFLFMPFWGKACDRYGTRKVLLVSGVFIGAVPLLWFWGYMFPMIFVIQILAGFGWAGFEIASFNFLFDHTTHANRVSVIAVYSMANGIMGLAGTFAAGALISWAKTWPGAIDAAARVVNTWSFLPDPLCWSPYLPIFILSGVIRLILTFVFASRLKETRRVQHIAARHLPLRILSMMTNQVIVARLSDLSRIIRRKPRPFDEPVTAPKKRRGSVKDNGARK